MKRTNYELRLFQDDETYYYYFDLEVIGILRHKF